MKYSTIMLGRQAGGPKEREEGFQDEPPHAVYIHIEIYNTIARHLEERAGIYRRRGSEKMR